MAKENLLGKNGILSVYVDTAYLPLGCLTSNDLNRTLELQDGTLTKCDDDPEPIPGRSTYELSFSAVATDGDIAHASLLVAHELFDTKNLINWKHEITKKDASKITRYGKGYFTSLSEAAPVDGEITFDGTIQGVGAISDTDLVV